MLANPSQEVKYRLAKWVVANLEAQGLLTPDEIKRIWEELLDLYTPPTQSIEVPCGSMINPLQGVSKDGESH